MPEFYGKLEQLVLFTVVRLNPCDRVFYTYWPQLYLRTGMDTR